MVHEKQIVYNRGNVSVPLRVPVLTLVQIHGGMENLGFGQFVIGNLQREDPKTNLEEH